MDETLLKKRRFLDNTIIEHLRELYEHNKKIIVMYENGIIDIITKEYFTKIRCDGKAFSYENGDKYFDEFIEYVFNKLFQMQYVPYGVNIIL